MIKNAIKMKREVNVSDKVKQCFFKASSWVCKNKFLILSLFIAYTLFSPMHMAFAASAKWNSVISFFLPWIQKLGGVVILLGGVEFGLAFKNDDAEGKTKGVRTLIAGVIVLAVGLGSATFLY